MNILKKLKSDGPQRYQFIRAFNLKPPGNRTHYDALGITPNATQEEVKTAYYKLSKLYHPDRNKGSEVAAAHFKTITEAYEILGNFKRRRLYDKGIPGDKEGLNKYKEEEVLDPQTRFYRSRGSTPSGKTPIFNFDEWSKNHYEASFQRREAAKKRHKNSIIKNAPLEPTEYFVAGGIILIVLAFYFTSKITKEHEDFDSPKKKS